MSCNRYKLKRYSGTRALLYPRGRRLRKGKKLIQKNLAWTLKRLQRYGAKDFLVLTYAPVSDFTDEETIINLQFFKSKIEKLTWVDSVISIIDVPLLKSTNEPLMERIKNYKTLSYPEVDKKRGVNEILNSPIYRDYVISKDGKTSGIVVYLKQDKKLKEYLKIVFYKVNLVLKIFLLEE